jgi:hypothetical protein
MRTEAPREGEELDAMGPEQGGGPPVLMPWTLIVSGEDWSADLEHGAALPRVGEHVEYIAEDGARRTFVVRQVVHTVQSSASERPPVRAEAAGPNSTVSGAHIAHVPTALRAGLPRVIVAEEA